MRTGTEGRPCGGFSAPPMGDGAAPRTTRSPSTITDVSSAPVPSRACNITHRAGPSPATAAAMATAACPARPALLCERMQQMLCLERLRPRPRLLGRAKLNDAAVAAAGSRGQLGSDAKTRLRCRHLSPQPSHQDPAQGAGDRALPAACRIRVSSLQRLRRRLCGSCVPRTASTALTSVSDGALRPSCRIRLCPSSRSSSARPRAPARALAPPAH